MNNDLISRSALLNEIYHLSHLWEYGKGVKDCKHIIENAPTVELTESEVQEVLNKRCMTAVANEYLIALHGKTERPKGDLISRQDAIDALEEQLDYLQMLNKNENPTAEGKWYGVNWARNTIADLPYKQNERPKGEWLRDKNGFYCSGCGARAAKDNYLMELRTNFCPDCGIDLRGKVE